MAYMRSAQVGSLCLLSIFFCSVGQASDVQIIYAFKTSEDGSMPYGLGLDSVGDLYGTTAMGGSQGRGSIFRIAVGGKEKNLYSFTGGSDGYFPSGSLALDSAGNLYGTTQGGGDLGYGTIYKLGTDGAFTLLHSFQGTDGADPRGGLMIDSDGNLFGTSSGSDGPSTIWEVSSAGQFQTLYDFTGGADGDAAVGGLIQDVKGNFFGTTYAGGANNCGTIYEFTTTKQLIPLHSLSFHQGCAPTSQLAMDVNGNLYGTASYAGPKGYGSLYKVTPDGKFSIVHAFAGKADGRYPGNLISDPAGNIYGASTDGGKKYLGDIFEVTAAGQFSMVYSFKGKGDGRHPYSDFIPDGQGHFLGTTVDGGRDQSGTVYRFIP